MIVIYVRCGQRGLPAPHQNTLDRIGCRRLHSNAMQMAMLPACFTLCGREVTFYHFTVMVRVNVGFSNIRVMVSVTVRARRLGCLYCSMLRIRCPYRNRRQERLWLPVLYMYTLSHPTNCLLVQCSTSV